MCVITQTGKIRKSLDIFTSLIQEDINFVIDADVEHDDCPCPELVEKFEDVESQADHDLENKIMLAILWLYCDVEKSLKYFEFANKQDPGNLKIEQCFGLIQNYLKNQNSKVKISL